MWNNFLVDADETLLDFLRSSKESFLYALKQIGLQVDDSDFNTFKKINDELWREYEQGKIRKQVLMRARFERFLQQKNFAEDAERLNSVYFKKLSETGYLLDGAENFIYELKKRGKLYLITNGTPAAQYGRLKNLGILELFDGIFVSDEISAAKPSEKFFSIVMDKIKKPKKTCVVIGDSLTSDVQGANNANIECIWFSKCSNVPKEINAKPNYKADSYSEIISIIDRHNQNESETAVADE